MAEAFRKLREGAKRFQDSTFHDHRELFESLAKGQSPKVLLITCADSRVVPSLISGTKPGELFVERNPGALVPVYSRQAVGVSASIEYAVKVLGVQGIVICGHSDCGAMSAALHPEKTRGVPAVARWLRFANAAVESLSEREKKFSPAKLQEAVTRHCIRVQMQHLLTHPSVREAVETRKLTIRGVYYEIGTGRLARVASKRG
jgi:carbonic anhydrase